jgi:hypothetical protein
MFIISDPQAKAHQPITEYTISNTISPSSTAVTLNFRIRALYASLQPISAGITGIHLVFPYIWWDFTVGEKSLAEYLNPRQWEGNVFCKTNLSLSTETLEVPDDSSLQEEYRRNGEYGLRIGLEIKKRPNRPAWSFLIKISARFCPFSSKRR